MATSKARVERRTTNGAFFGDVQATNDWKQEVGTDNLVNEQYKATQSQRTISGQFKAGAFNGEQSETIDSYQTTDYADTYSQPVSLNNVPRIRRKKKRASKAKTSLARARVSAINIWIWAAVGTFYIFQVVLALVSTIALGMWYAAEFIVANGGVSETEKKGWFDVIVDGITETVQWLINAVTTAAAALFQVDFEIYNLFILCYAAVIFFGMLQLMTVWFIYRANMINSLSGKAAGAKMAAFLAAGIGFCIPVVNLFPIIIAWTITVWFYPK